MMFSFVSREERRPFDGRVLRIQQQLRRFWLFVRENELNGLGDTVA